MLGTRGTEAPPPKLVPSRGRSWSLYDAPPWLAAASIKSGSSRLWWFADQLTTHGETIPVRRRLRTMLSGQSRRMRCQSFQAPLSRLHELALNLNWAWNHDTLELFHRVDSDLWAAQSSIQLHAAHADLLGRRRSKGRAIEITVLFIEPEAVVLQDQVEFAGEEAAQLQAG